MCEIFKNNYFEEHLRTTASKHRSGFLEVFCKSCCLALINALMKYSFSVAVVQESTTCKLTKNCTPSQVFFKEFFHKCRTAIMKNVSWWLFLRTNLFWKHSYILEIHILHFLFWRHLKRNEFLWLFLSKGFGETCKPIELALNFVQKQNFS